MKQYINQHLSPISMAECCCHKLVPGRPIVIQVQVFDTSNLPNQDEHKKNTSPSLSSSKLQLAFH